MEKNFKSRKLKHDDTIGFESWYIDYKGDLCGIRGDIELFIFLCDITNFPETLLNTKITPILPKNLPQQRSIIIKGVPDVMNIEDIKIEIMNKYKSLYYFGEVPGTNNGKIRYLRIDMMNLLEYKYILNAGTICIDGQCLHAYEFLASPKILFCSMCNRPGHTCRQCNLSFERCKRCSANRKEGEHRECIINCHNCQGNHISTDCT